MSSVEADDTSFARMFKKTRSVSRTATGIEESSIDGECSLVARAMASEDDIQ